MKKRHPKDELIFLMGTDMLLSFLTWYEPDTILSCASLAVFARENGREGGGGPGGRKNGGGGDFGLAEGRGRW